MPSGVSLLSRTVTHNIGEYVHHRSNDWVIVSTQSVAEFTLAVNPPILDVLLPGLLGAFVYPRDAVFLNAQGECTNVADLEREICKQHHARSETQAKTRTKHVCVSAPVAVDEHPECDDAECDDDDSVDEGAVDEDVDDSCADYKEADEVDADCDGRILD